MNREQRDVTFSERIGAKPVRTVLQTDSMDEALRNTLWNVLHDYIFDRYLKGGRAQASTTEGRVVMALWRDHFKYRVDAFPVSCPQVVQKLRNEFYGCYWSEVYDLIEFVTTRFDSTHFRSTCNRMLAREQSGYRFVDQQLVPIISELEIEAIETALTRGDEYRPASVHLRSALDKLADRESPDYRNSIKESISAVEAMCQIVTGSDKGTLGQAVKKLEDSGVKLHKAFQDALSKMYGYTSDADGIRHALLEESTLDADDARFMLVSCSAFVNYLKAKSA